VWSLLGTIRRNPPGKLGAGEFVVMPAWVQPPSSPQLKPHGEGSAFAFRPLMKAFNNLQKLGPED
jgi:hypothetical protein